MKTEIVNLIITNYPACDECAHYLATGDGSAIELHPDSDDIFNDIDSTLGAILRDNHPAGAYVLESLSTTGSSSVIKDCPFCGETHLGNAAIQVCRKVD